MDYSIDKWYEDSPQRVLENGDCEIYWNLNIQTDKIINFSFFPSYLKCETAVCCSTKLDFYELNKFHKVR